MMYSDGGRKHYKEGSSEEDMAGWYCIEGIKSFGLLHQFPKRGFE